MLSKLKQIVSKKPLIKGMIAYSILWPTSSLIQQTIEGKKLESYDWMRCARFSIYGCFYVAPSLHCWVKLTTHMWPYTNLRTGLVKALLEQISYGPFANTSFYIGMAFLENKTITEAIDELNQKFFPTMKVALCVWPILQTINFSLVPEKNRVVFVSICSVMWTTFLAYMKQLKKEEEIKVIFPEKPLNSK